MGPVTDDVICDLAEDWVPSIGLLAPPRVLGPWAMLALPRRLRMFCGAVMSFSPVFPPSIRPMSRPGRTKPKVDGVIKSALIAVLRAPMMLWVPTVDGELEPLLPMARRSRPEGPVTGIPDAPAVLGRAVQHPDGWWLACALPLPVRPDVSILQRRLELEYQRLRRHDRRMTWEDILRDRSELVCRTVCEWLWVRPRRGLPLRQAWSEGGLHRSASFVLVAEGLRECRVPVLARAGRRAPAAAGLRGRGPAPVAVRGCGAPPSSRHPPGP